MPIRDQYPEVRINTLAYQMTEDPPKTLRPRDNVMPRLCDTNANLLRPITHPDNRAFAERLATWGRIAKNLRIWDYAVTYTPYYGLPLPTVHTYPIDYRYFAEHNVEGVFTEHEYADPGRSAGPEDLDDDQAAGGPLPRLRRPGAGLHRRLLRPGRAGDSPLPGRSQRRPRAPRATSTGSRPCRSTSTSRSTFCARPRRRSTRRKRPWPAIPCCCGGCATPGCPSIGPAWCCGRS